MDEVLTLAQIEAQFQSEWVLVEEPQTNDALEVQSGKLRWHSKDREEVYRKVVEMHPRRFAILYTGKMPEGTAIVLCISLLPSTTPISVSGGSNDHASSGYCDRRITSRNTPCWLG